MRAGNRDSLSVSGFGTHEPDRAFQDGAGSLRGKRHQDVEVPKFYPDNETIRRDLADYAVESEWFDVHLGRIVRTLEEAGELGNTLILATSDHSMPFPRVKGRSTSTVSTYLWRSVGAAGGKRQGRTVEDFINVRDFAPTMLQLAGVEAPDSMTGRSFVDILESDRSGWVDRNRNRMLIGKERHDLGRPNDWGYPVRAIRTPEYLYLRNFEPDRWPAGNPETGYRNCDPSPTKSSILRSFDEYDRLSFGKRPAEELYRVEQPG